MFSSYCPTHDASVLLTRRNVINFWNGPDGPVIKWRCNCGHEGTLGRSGNDADPIHLASSTPAGGRQDVQVRADNETLVG